MPSPTIIVNRYVVIIPADVKLFRRRERKIGTGADVLAYVKVVPVAPFEVCGRIFKAGSAEAKSLPLLALASSSPGRASARPSLAGKPALVFKSFDIKKTRQPDWVALFFCLRATKRCVKWGKND